MKVIVYYMSISLGTHEDTMKGLLAARKAELQAELGAPYKIIMMPRYEEQNYGDHIEVLDLTVPYIQQMMPNFYPTVTTTTPFTTGPSYTAGATSTTKY